MIPFSKKQLSLSHIYLYCILVIVIFWEYAIHKIRQLEYRYHLLCDFISSCKSNYPEFHIVYNTVALNMKACFAMLTTFNLLWILKWFPGNHKKFSELQIHTVGTKKKQFSNGNTLQRLYCICCTQIFQIWWFALYVFFSCIDISFIVYYCNCLWIELSFLLLWVLLFL